MIFNYPLKLTFRLIALAPRIEVRDPSMKEVFYIEQKLLAFREKVTVYSNSEKTTKLFGIQANQIIDIGATYTLTKADSDQAIGLVKQQGLQTFWRATYDIFDSSNKQVFQVKEKNPWVKTLDFTFQLIPFVGFFAGYFIHPEYLLLDVKTNQAVMSLKKQPSFLERSFTINSLKTDLTQDQEILGLLAFTIITQLEQGRG